MKKLITSLLLLSATVSVKATTLELTQGHNAETPVAVVQFAGLPAMSHVIANDLRHVGQFDVQYQANSHAGNAPASVLAAKWRNSGVNDVIVGDVKKVGEHYNVTYTLVDVYSQNAHGPSDSALSSRSFHFTFKQMRQVAHAISNDVYYQLTGKQGAFNSKIAYVLSQGDAQHPSYQLRVADYDGANAMTLVHSTLPLISPRWSPSGKELAYVSFGQKGSEVFLLNVITGQRTLLLHFPGLNASPAWSPDGRKLAVTLSHNDAQDIYLLNIATKTLQQITRGASIDTEPTFAYNGKSLLFVSNRQDEPQVYQYSFADGDAIRLTYNGRFNVSPQFMPGDQAFVMVHKAENGYTIAKQNLSDSVLTDLTPTSLVQSPSVAPNGSMIIYSDQSHGGVLKIVSANGKAHFTLPIYSGANMQEPAWGK